MKGTFTPTDRVKVPFMRRGVRVSVPLTEAPGRCVRPKLSQWDTERRRRLEVQGRRSVATTNTTVACRDDDPNHDARDDERDDDPDCGLACGSRGHVDNLQFVGSATRDGWGHAVFPVARTRRGAATARALATDQPIRAPAVANCEIARHARDCLIPRTRVRLA